MHHDINIMFVRPHMATVKAFRHTQKKGKAFRIKANAIIKKTVKERDMLRTVNDTLLVDCTEAEEKCLDFKRKHTRSLKKLNKLKRENRTLKKRIDIIDKFAMPLLIWTVSLLTAVTFLK
jgi:hypothetical protein